MILSNVMLEDVCCGYVNVSLKTRAKNKQLLCASTVVRLPVCSQKSKVPFLRVNIKVILDS